MKTAHNESLNALLKGTAALPSLPAIAARIIKEVKKDKLAIAGLAEIISYDPALSAKILKIANSSFYALPYKVDSIERAVSIIGLEALKNIALSFVIVKGLKKNAVDEFDHEHFWKRSITAAVSADMIASRLKINRDETFVTSLLMDVGVLAMYMSRPEEYLRVINEKKVSHLPTCSAERYVWGFDHQDVGGAILKEWGIPDSIYLPIGYHHEDKGYPRQLKDLIEVLRLSDISSSVYHGSKTTEKFSELRRLLQDRMNLTDLEVGEFVDSIAERTVEVLSTFEIDAGNMKPYSQILEEANEELGKLNLSYEQLVMELKQAKELAEKLAVEAWEAKEKLRELAVKDGLTNLYNHRYFQSALDREIERTERYGRQLSLVIMDIDFFKRINDTHGHPQGDIVLRSIAELLGKMIRRPDVAARYGGEEFAIVLPETDIKGAVVVADRIRKAVENLDIAISNNQKVSVTVSLGVTTYDPVMSSKTKTELVESADKALYNSKQNGRNKVSIVA